MRSWKAGAALALTLLVAPVARADEGVGAFSRVRLDHWGYASVRRLEKSGYFTGTSEGTFGGLRELTRYEFSVAIDKIYRSLQPRILSATDPTGLRADLDEFRRLLSEFTPDVAGLGSDVTEMRSQLEVMERRLARLEKDAESRPGAERSTGLIGGKRPFGFQGLLDRSVLSAPGATLPGAISSTYLLPSPLQPGLAARVGAASFGFRVQGPDRLDTMAGLPLEDPSAGLNYLAQLNLPVGRYLFSAYYNRDGGRFDRYGLLNPVMPLGAVSSVGGAVAGSLTSRLGFQVEGATLRPLDQDLTQTTYLKGGVNYAISSRLTLSLGWERTRQFGAPGMLYDASAYLFGLQRSFGRNTLLNLNARFGDNTGGAVDSGTRDSGVGAITSLTVRF